MLRILGWMKKWRKRLSEKYDVNIYNATRGGRIEIFQRVALEDVVY